MLLHVEFCRLLLGTIKKKKGKGKVTHLWNVPWVEEAHSQKPLYQIPVGRASHTTKSPTDHDSPQTLPTPF